jgi:hypothetical protein
MTWILPLWPPTDPTCFAVPEASGGVCVDVALRLWLRSHVAAHEQDGTPRLRRRPLVHLLEDISVSSLFEGRGGIGATKVQRGVQPRQSQLRRTLARATLNHCAYVVT